MQPIRYLQPTVIPRPELDLMEVAFDFNILVLSELIHIPATFRFDGQSGGKLGHLVTYSRYSPVTLLATCVHDFLYATHLVSRAKADAIFFHLLICNGADRALAKAMYFAVRTFGKAYY